MSYLEQLRQQDEKKKIRGGAAPTKPTKPAFVSSDGGAPPPVGNFEPLRASRRAIIAARDAAPLADFREALLLARLHVCGNCANFTYAAKPVGLGQCSHFDVETWPFVPFQCIAYLARRDPNFLTSTRAREGIA